MIDGARRYAEANRSDPFAFSRAMSHVNNGVAGIRIENDERIDAFYDAKVGIEKRKLPTGQLFSDGSNSYEVPAYHEVKVP
jgi:hypothetical protein